MVDLSVLNGIDLACRVYKNNVQAKRLGREGVIQGPKKSAQGPLVYGSGVKAPVSWGIGCLVVTELSPVAAGGYNLRPFVQQSGWISQGDHHFFSETADVTPPCATLIWCCALGNTPLNLVIQVLVLEIPDVF